MLLEVQRLNQEGLKTDGEKDIKQQEVDIKKEQNRLKDKEIDVRKEVEEKKIKASLKNPVVGEKKK